MILTNYEENLHIESDLLFQEVSQHWQAVQKKCELFLGREDLLDSILKYQQTTSGKQVGWITELVFNS